MSTKRERGDYVLPGQEGKGFVQIPNDMWRVLRHFQGSKHELQVFMAIYELTITWKHEWQRIANKTLSKMTGIPSRKINEPTGGLVRRKMIRQEWAHAEDSRGRVQRFNEFAIEPDMSKWEVSPKRGIPQPGQPDDGGIPDLGPTTPRFGPVSIPDLGEHTIHSLQDINIQYMSGMTPGRADSLSENPLRRNHPLDDKEKAEFSRILADFYKEHPHKDLVPAEVEFFYKSLTERYPDVDLIFVLQQKIEAWRKKAPKCFRQRPKNSKVTQEQNPVKLLEDAFAKAHARLRELGR